MLQRFGSGFGQNGSTRNCGAPASSTACPGAWRDSSGATASNAVTTRSAIVLTSDFECIMGGHIERLTAAEGGREMAADDMESIADDAAALAMARLRQVRQDRPPIRRR